MKNRFFLKLFNFYLLIFSNFLIAENIVFNFDLTDQVVSESGPHIAGSWQGWDASTDAMTDLDGDGIFSYEINLTTGDTVYYKFINGNSWSDPHDQMLEGESCVAFVDEYVGNRMFIVPEAAYEIPPACMNSCEPCNVEPPQGNYSLSFDGLDDYVEVPPSSNLVAANNEISVEAWVKIPSSNNNAHSTIFGARLGYGYVLYAGSNDISVPGAANFVVFTSNDSWIELQGTMDLRDDQWHHVAATYNGTVAKLYIDGQLDNEIYFSTDYLSTLDGGSYNTNIGTANHASEYFMGSIDDLAIWNIDLTNEQIQSHMNGSIPLDMDGLSAYWDMNEGEGDNPNYNLLDMSGNGNNGTISGATWSDDVPSIVPTSTANITFQADMSFLIEQGWDDNIHTLELRGDFNQWGPGEPISTNETALYTITREITAENNSFIQWKFKANPDEAFENSGWESVDNRFFLFTGEDIILEPTEPNISFMPEPVASISVGMVDGMENMTVSVPIYIELLDHSASSIQLNFSGFQPYMDFIDILTFGSMVGEASWDFEFNSNEDMLLTLAYGASELSGNGRLFEILFEINEDIETSFIPINVDYVQIDELEIDVELNHGGVEIITLWGDVSQNGDVSGFDASLVLKYLVGTEDLDYSQLLAAEVTQDGTISALDATAIAQYVVDIIDSLPVVNIDQLSGNGEFYFDELEFNPGSSMQIPINLINGDNLLSFEMECEYDPNALTIETTDWSNLISHFSIEDNYTLGNFKVAGMGTSPDGEEGVFGIFNIQVNPNFNDPQTIVNVAYRINESEYIDNMTIVINNSSLSVDSDAIPLAFNLYSNYPNPFNPTTSIKYDLPNKSMVNLTIYDVMGRKVMSLINDYKAAGSHSVQWDATNDLGQPVSAGMYIYTIQAGNYRQVKKMVLLK